MKIQAPMLDNYGQCLSLSYKFQINQLKNTILMLRKKWMIAIAIREYYHNKPIFC